MFLSHKTTLYVWTDLVMNYSPAVVHYEHYGHNTNLSRMLAWIVFSIELCVAPNIYTFTENDVICGAKYKYRK